MVSLPHCGSLWALAQVPTGHTLPFAPCRGLGQTPGRSIVAEGAGRAHRSFRSPPSGRFALCATAHRADASLRCPKPEPQHKKASVASARRAQETRLAQPLPEYQRKRRGHPLPGGAAPLLFKKHYHWKDPRFSRPFGRSQRSTGFAAGSAAVLPLLPASSRVSCSLRSLATLDGLCRRKRWRPPASSCIKPRFLASLRSLATLDGLCRRKRRRPPLIPASSRVSCVPVAQSFALP